MADYYVRTRDGGLRGITAQDIRDAFAAGRCRLVLGYRDHGTTEALSVDGRDWDTRGEVYSVWEATWTRMPDDLSQALTAAYAGPR